MSIWEEGLYKWKRQSSLRRKTCHQSDINQTVKEQLGWPSFIPLSTQWHAEILGEISFIEKREKGWRRAWNRTTRAAKIRNQSNILVMWCEWIEKASLKRWSSLFKWHGHSVPLTFIAPLEVLFTKELCVHRNLQACQKFISSSKMNIYSHSLCV